MPPHVEEFRAVVVVAVEDVAVVAAAVASVHVAAEASVPLAEAEQH